MAALPLHLLALVSATLVVVRGAPFAWLRPLWPALFGCAQCTGFWVGAFAGGARLVAVGHSRPVDALVVGFATSFLALAADALLLKLLGDPSEET